MLKYTHGHIHETYHQHHDHREIFTKHHQECVDKLNVPTDRLDNYAKFDYPDDEITRCYTKCIFEQSGLFGEDSGFNVHKLHHHLVGEHGTVDHSDKTHAEIAKCVENKAEDANKCTTAYKGFKCMLDSNLLVINAEV